MVGQVKGEHAKPLGDIGIVEQMAPLARIGAGSVQANQGCALTGFFIKNAVWFSIHIHIHITASDWFDAAHAASFLIRFIKRCSARAFCMATRPSPSSTKSGTRMSMAKKSLYSGGGLGVKNLAQMDMGA